MQKTTRQLCYRNKLTPVSLAAGLLLVLAADEAAPRSPVSGGDAVTGEQIEIAPGRVALATSPAGRLLSFGSSADRRASRALITGGGVVVYTTRDNTLIELLNTSRGTDMGQVNGVRVAHEGVRNGNRFPSPQPDDDGDGRVDEEWLDGYDNDGDGRIDEDFAAIGDEMVATDYASGDVRIHQESYAWSLPHLADMVATQFVVRNKGDMPIDRVRVGLVFDTRRDLVLDTQTDQSGGGLTVKAMRLHGDRDGLAVLFFAPAKDKSSSWLAGVTGGESTVAETIRLATGVERVARMDGQPAAQREATRIRSYGVSPEIERLEPHEEVSIFVAMVRLSSDDEGNARAIDYAYRTVIGDGVHRLIPPPMSVTKQLLDVISSDEPETFASSQAYFAEGGKLDETLVSNSPNPFHDETTIYYEVPSVVIDDADNEIRVTESIDTSVKVYAVTGRLIRTLVEASRSPGRYSTTWTPDNATGGLASGVYYVKLQLGKRFITKRIIRVK